jgi:hypothetical protein
MLLQPRDGKVWICTIVEQQGGYLLPFPGSSGCQWGPAILQPTYQIVSRDGHRK